MSFLYKGAQAKICVLTGTMLSDLQLPVEFLQDLRQALPQLSVQAICQDVLNDAMHREGYTRYLNGSYLHNGAFGLRYSNCYTMLAMLLLRPAPLVKGLRERSYRPLSALERHSILKLLDDYGVSCVTGACCQLVPDPLSPTRETSEQTKEALA